MNKEESPRGHYDEEKERISRTYGGVRGPPRALSLTAAYLLCDWFYSLDFIIIFDIVDDIEEIVKIANLRLKEAKILFASDCFDGSIYLAGYCVELLLKAKIAQLLDVDNLFVSVGKEKIKPFRTHKLTDLALYAGLHKEVSEEENETFKEFWSLLYSQWSEDLRYKKCGSCTKLRAENFIKAIEDPINGIQKWIEEKLAA